MSPADKKSRPAERLGGIPNDQLGSEVNSNSTALARVRDALDRRDLQVRTSGDGRLQAQCPAHPDRSPSLSVKAIDGSVLLFCHAGCATGSVVNALGLTMADLFEKPTGSEYSYPGGRVVHRSPNKNFRQSGNTKDRNLFRADEVRAAVAAGQLIYVVEGEKDVLALESVGVTATCSPMGAGKWSVVDPSPLFGGVVVVVADRDKPGRAHAAQVAESLAGHAKVVVVQARLGKDAADHVAAGHGLDEFDPIEIELQSEAGEVAALDERILAREWPQLDPVALHGVAGDLVLAADPTTEADPAAVLVSLLAAFGVWVGVGPHLRVANNRHPALLWPLIVGRTAAGAKGTSMDVVKRMMLAADPEFGERISSGLSSGEGLIEAVRDEAGDDPDAKDYDPGVPDKRLLVIEPEYASVLARMARQGSTLGAVLRDAWDGTPLRTMNRKSSKLRADMHHIAVIGHVTPVELVSRLDAADLAGGSINRLLPICSKRSKLLPEGGNLPGAVLASAAQVLNTAKAAAKDREYSRTPAAEHEWRRVYRQLAVDRGEGREAQATARAVPQVLRLALVYALLDSAPAVDVPHLNAAHALWRYAEASARYVFGNPERPEADSGERAALMVFIARAGDAGATATNISVDLYRRHKPAAEIRHMLRELVESGQIEQTEETTAGRPRSVFTLRNKVNMRTMVSDLRKPGREQTSHSANDANEPSTALDVISPHSQASETISVQVSEHNSLNHLVRGAEVTRCKDCGRPATNVKPNVPPRCIDCRAAIIAGRTPGSAA